MGGYEDGALSGEEDPMNPGYLYLETHADHPGLVRCLTLDRMPVKGGEIGGGGPLYRLFHRYRCGTDARSELTTPLAGGYRRHMYRSGSCNRRGRSPKRMD